MKLVFASKLRELAAPGYNEALNLLNKASLGASGKAFSVVGDGVKSLNELGQQGANAGIGALATSAAVSTAAVTGGASKATGLGVMAATQAAEQSGITAAAAETKDRFGAAAAAFAPAAASSGLTSGEASADSNFLSWRAAYVCTHVCARVRTRERLRCACAVLDCAGGA